MKNEIEVLTTKLQIVGDMTERARRAGKSLTTEQREAIVSVRLEARQRLSPQMINAIEAEGAKAVRS